MAALKSESRRLFIPGNDWEKTKLGEQSGHFACAIRSADHRVVHPCNYGVGVPKEGDSIATTRVGPDAVVRAGELSRQRCRAERGWAGEGTRPYVSTNIFNRGCPTLVAPDFGATEPAMSEVEGMGF